MDRNFCLNPVSSFRVKKSTCYCTCTCNTILVMGKFGHAAGTKSCCPSTFGAFDQCSYFRKT